MAGSHAHCHHHDARSMSEGKLRLSIGLTFGFVLLETIIGFRANSLALISDAGHNFTDGLALVLSWYALWIARKPATATKTFGYHRVGILTALFNALTLILIALFIFHEAWDRFRNPQPIASVEMIAVATVALLMNTVIALWLHGEAARDINMRSAFIHMVGDALSSAGVIMAGIFIYFTGSRLADPLVSVLIGLFIAYSSWGILVETVNILLEGVPRGLDIGAMARAIQAVPGVEGVHDLHVWTIADDMNALSCHLRIGDAQATQAAGVVRDVKTMLALEYAVNHSTIETECGGCDTNALYCQMTTYAAHSACDHDHSHA